MKTNKIIYTWMSFMLIAAILLTGCGQQASTSKNAASEPKKEEAKKEQPKKIDFPTKPIKIIVPYAAGGVTDLAVRAVANAAGKYLPNGQFVVENKVGGGGGIGTAEVIKSPADGYTLGYVGMGVLTNLPHFGKVEYTYTDVTPVMQNAAVPMLLVVRKDATWNSFEEWQTYAKANPGKFTYATSGAGTLNHILMESMGSAIKAEVKHVPYNGDAPAITALLGGHVQGVVVSATSILPQIRDGNLKALAILGVTKLSEFPNIPTLKEKGINVGMDGLFVFVAPKGLPVEIRDILYTALRKASEDPEVAAVYKKLELNPAYRGPDDLGKTIAEDFKNNAEGLKAAGLIK